MSNEHTRGLLYDFLTALDDAEARATSSPYGARGVEEIGCDPHRLAVSGEAKRSKAFLRGTLEGLREHTKELRRVNTEYDAVADE